MIYNRIPIALGGLTKVKGPAINYQYDQKQILILTGLELPDYYTVDFCNDGDQQTKPMVGTADGVEIPDEFLLTGRPVKAYLIVTGEDDGAVETRYEIKLPVNQRPARTDITPTPAEQSTIDGLIEAMNQAVTDTEEAAEQAGQAVLHYPKVVNEYWYVWDVTAEDYVNTGYKATGSGTGISDAYLNADYTLTLEFTDGTSYTTPSIRGEPGPVGATPDFDIGTVTTGQPGTPASATITGTAAEPLLNLTIPKGDPGEVTQSEFDTAIGTINSALSSLQSVTEIIDTASGAIASFPDGSGLPMRSLVAEINPIQDLHGQDAPYPAGGGKNLAYLTYGDKVPSTSSGQMVDSNGWSSDFISVDNSKSYVVSVNQAYNRYILFYDSSKNYLGYVSAWTQSGYVLNNYANWSSSAFIKCRVDSQQAQTFNIQLELGTTATAWTPYSNICPITGHTGLSVEVRGKNLLDPQYNVITSNNIKPYQNNGFALKANETYTFSASETASGLYIIKFGTNDSVASKYNNTSVTYTPTEDIVVYFNAYYATVPAGGLNQVKLQLELGSSASSYEPYTSGTTTTVSWQDEAGTVYGGTLDVVSGLLTVDRAEHTVSANDVAELFQTGTNANRIGIKVSDSQLSPTNTERLKIISNIAKADTSVLTASAQKVGDCCMYSGGAMTYSVALFGVPTTATSSADARSWLVGQGCTFVYYLATPQTYQLTPQEVDTLVGQNNIWVDTGNVEVTYQASIKGYIDKVLGS